MSILRIAGACALLIVLGTSARAAAEPLAPTGKWNVDFGDTHCIAMRSYGPPDRPLTLALKPSPVGDVMQLSVLRESSSNQTGQYDGTLTVDQSPPVKVSVLGFAPKGSKQRIHSVNLPSAVYQSVRPANALHLRSSGQIDQSFALSNMAPVARALDRCVADLRRVWNITGAGDAVTITQAPRPRKPMSTLFGSDDYPRVAWLADAGGTVALTLLIDEGGKVASCMVIQPSGLASLDAQSCAIIMVRAKFDPALGVDGRPTKSGITTRIKWMMQ